MIYIDTGAFLGRYLVRDQHHDQACAGWRLLAERRERCATSNFVLDETFTLLGRRASCEFAAERARNLLKSTSLQILRPEADDELAAVALFEKFADQKVSFTDCISFFRKLCRTGRSPNQRDLESVGLTYAAEDGVKIGCEMGSYFIPPAWYGPCGCTARSWSRGNRPPSPRCASAAPRRPRDLGTGGRRRAVKRSWSRAQPVARARISRNNGGNNEVTMALGPISANWNDLDRAGSAGFLAGSWAKRSAYQRPRSCWERRLPSRLVGEAHA